MSEIKGVLGGFEAHDSTLRAKRNHLWANSATVPWRLLDSKTANDLLKP